MSPSLRAGDIVVARHSKQPSLNDLIIFRRNGRELIKRMSSQKDDSYFVLGDNSDQSTDSRHFGAVSKTDILGVIIMKLQFAHATDSPRVTRRSLFWIPYAAALGWIFVLLLYLYFFEQSVRLSMTMFDVFATASGVEFLRHDVLAKLFTAIFSLAILFGLPFLMRMRLSPLARMMSVGSLMLASVLYVSVSILFSVGRAVLTLDILIAGVLFVLSMLSLLILNVREVFRWR